MTLAALIYLLIISAEDAKFSNFEKLTDLEWQEVFDVNIMRAVRSAIRASFPLLRASPCGRVINIASVAGKRPKKANPHYGAMKADMIHLSKYLSNQWGKKNMEYW